MRCSLDSVVQLVGGVINIPLTRQMMLVDCGCSQWLATFALATAAPSRRIPHAAQTRCMHNGRLTTSVVALARRYAAEHDDLHMQVF